MTNKELYDKALKAIEALFGDTSVSIDKAIENLEKLDDEINVMIDNLKASQQ